MGSPGVHFVSKLGSTKELTPSQNSVCRFIPTFSFYVYPSMFLVCSHSCAD